MKTYIKDVPILSVFKDQFIGRGYMLFCFAYFGLGDMSFEI